MCIKREKKQHMKRETITPIVSPFAKPEQGVFDGHPKMRVSHKRETRVCNLTQKFHQNFINFEKPKNFPKTLKVRSKDMKCMINERKRIIPM